MDSADAEDEDLVGFGEWGDTEIDEAVQKVKREIDEDFEKDA